MSAVCAIVRLDGRVADQAELAPTLVRLEARGPDATRSAAAGPAALGCALLATTPEALAEQLPLEHGGSGCIITADARLDNRPELMAALEMNDPQRIVGDGELILRAYLKWGLDCPQHLLGDFAFALWDPRHRRLLCVRDQLGMRQLLYHHQPDSLFACATEAEALLAHPDVPERINEGRIADFLEDLEAYDLASTFYRDILRLPPAHAMVVGADGGLRMWRYWEPEPPTRLTLDSDAAYAEAFLAVFSEAVGARLRAPAGKLGSMLSGGMDSGSVTAVAAGLLKQAGAPPLATFSATCSAPDCVETRTIRLAQTMHHIAPSDVAFEDFDAFAEDLLRLSQGSGEPFDGHMVMLRAIYLAAHKAGFTVMLDGACGDTTLMADDMVAWRLRRGDLAGAWREAVGLRRFWGPDYPPMQSFIDGARHVIVPDWLRMLRRSITAGIRGRKQNKASLVAAALAARVDMPARRAAHAHHVAMTINGRCEDRRALVTHPYAVVGRERYDRVAGPLAIEPRDPFLDRRVLDFCLSLPPDQIESDGWPKMILRRSMAGLLPDQVRWRTGKEHVGWRFDEALSAHWLARVDPGWSRRMAPFVHEKRLTVAESGQNDELAVATRMTLGYLFWWMSR
jgi:asparagine synthase (glutamine-hydrolysing)